MFSSTQAQSAGVLKRENGASKIGYIEGGANSVARTMMDKGRDVISVLDFGNGNADSFNNAQDYVLSKGVKGGIYVPGGRTYSLNGDVEVGRGVVFYGDGYGSDIALTGGSFILSNLLSGSNSYCGLKNLRLRRTDASGICLRCNGDSSNGAVTRYMLQNLYLIRTDGKQGTAMSISGSWIDDFYSIFISGWDLGLEVAQDGPDYSWGLNAACFYGGQIEGNNTGVDIDAAIALGFKNVTIETNSTRGVRLNNARNVSFSDECYFEGNGNEDIQIGNTATCYSISIKDSYFNTTSPFKTHAIDAANCKGLSVEGNTFERFTAEPILISGSSVTGEARNNTKDSAISIGMVNVAANDRFHYKDSDYELKESELVIESGAITITSDFHVIDTEGDAASDNLETINGGVRGMRLTICAANSARTINFVETGNISIGGGVTPVLDNAQDAATFIYSENNAKWLLTGFISNAT